MTTIKTEADNNLGNTRYRIIQTRVCGLSAYHAECLHCRWTSPRQDFATMAVAHAETHKC